MFVEQLMPTKHMSGCLDRHHHNLGDVIPCLNSERTSPKRSSAKAGEDELLVSQGRSLRKQSRPVV